MSSVIKGDWNQFESVIFYLPKINVKSEKCVIFDLDGTLVASVRGSDPNSIISENDWMFYPNVVDALSDLQSNGYSILILGGYTFSDESNYKKTKTLLRCQKILEFLIGFDIHPFFFITTKKDRYRKPEKGCINLFKKILGGEYSLPQTFKYEFVVVGDGAGKKCSLPVYRNSSHDIELALNIGCDFYNPCDFFDFNVAFSTEEKNDFLLVLGNPGSGKTTLCEHISSEYEYRLISNDMKFDKKKSRLSELCKKGKSIILDGSFPARKDRKTFLDIAFAHNYSVRILLILTDGRNYVSKKNSEFEDYSRRFEFPVDEVDDVVILV